MQQTRKKLMKRLNELLDVSNNWERLNKFDLEQLVSAVEKLIDKFCGVGLK